MEASPFVPGAGNLPPYLAGREREQTALREHLRKLARQQSPGASVTLHGPRGNGKTALLEWAVRHARSLGVGVVSQSASVRQAEWALREKLSPLPGWMARCLRRFLDVKVPGFGIRMSDSQAGELTGLLASRSRWRPLLVALDEVHKMDPGLGRDLLNAVQELQREDRPVMLLLAGTPDLPRHLNRMAASFWERNENLPIGRLGIEDSADAVRVPFEAARRSIAPEALRIVARESHGYPYFLQLWGRELWNGCPRDSDPVSPDAVDRIRPSLQRTQRRFYGNRYSELQRAGLLLVAVAVAALFVGGERRARERVREAVAASLAESGRAADESAALENCERLCDLGYIRSVDDGPVPCYEPGIPSLMGYVANAVRARSEAESASGRQAG